MRATEPTTILEADQVDVRVSPTGRIRRGQLLGYTRDGAALRAPFPCRALRIRYEPSSESFLLVLSADLDAGAAHSTNL
ncbi:MAG: hypothetical protein HY240_00485 [Actinobacteria bacterium]|nr:hypothetical protein [Actinomycetota bacterium]